MTYRLSEEAEAEVDEIWIHIAQASASIEVANRVVDRLTDCFWLLSVHPMAGRALFDESQQGRRFYSCHDYVIIYRPEGETTLILHVVHGARDWVKRSGAR